MSQPLRKHPFTLFFAVFAIAFATSAFEFLVVDADVEPPTVVALAGEATPVCKRTGGGLLFAVDGGEDVVFAVSGGGGSPLGYRILSAAGDTLSEGEGANVPLSEFPEAVGVFLYSLDGSPIVCVGNDAAESADQEQRSSEASRLTDGAVESIRPPDGEPILVADLGIDVLRADSGAVTSVVSRTDLSGGHVIETSRAVVGQPLHFDSIADGVGSDVETKFGASHTMVESINSLHRNGSNLRDGTPPGKFYKITTNPDVGAIVTAVSGGCCTITTANTNGFYWVCSEDCRCCGSPHYITVSLLYGGYTLTGGLYVNCPCANEDDDENGVANRIAFSKDVVIFEDAYTNAPGVVMSKRSTAVTLAGRVVGGQYGGTLTVSLANGDKIGTVSGDILPTNILLSAGETYIFEIGYEGLKASASEGDIVAIATFSENVTGRLLSDTTSITSVKIEVLADATFPTNKVRHIFGPQESAKFVPMPTLNGIQWSVGGTNAVCSTYDYRASNEPTNDVATVSISGVDFIFPLEVVAPTRLESISGHAATSGEWLAQAGSYPIPGDVAVGLHTELRLMPDYVSFMHLFLQEGECPASNIWGFFVPYASGLLPHDANAGAWSEVGMSISDNYAGGDFAAANFGGMPVTWTAGGFEYNITNYWYVKENGNIIGSLHPFIVESQVYTFSPNGDLSVEKYKYTATRGTNDITTVTRSP